MMMLPMTVNQMHNNEKKKQNVKLYSANIQQERI